jgi:hypothetical protein
VNTYLDVSTIGHDLVLAPQCLVIGSVERGETPLLGHDDLLSSGELVSSSSEGLHDDGSVLVSASDRHDDLATKRSALIGEKKQVDIHVDSGNGSVGFTPSSSHTLLQPGC